MDKNSFYKPSGNVKDTNRTYVPDLYRQVAAEMQAEEIGDQSKDSSSSHVLKLQNRQIIGVLYSISAGIEGEMFPIYIGRNTLGSDLSCDICLRETSVSAFHGILLARKQIDEGGEEYINVILSDNNSVYGTCVNGERLSFEKVECFDGDVLSVGQNYVLIISLFNAINKLRVAVGFDRMPDDPQNVGELKEPQTEMPEMTINKSSLSPQNSDHSTNITAEPQEESTADFYKPTKQEKQDHYNNKTIIL